MGRPVLQLAQAVQETSQAVQDTSQAVQDTSQAVQETSQAVQDTSQAVQDTSQAVQDTSLAVQDTSQAVQDTSQAVQDTEVMRLPQEGMLVSSQPASSLIPRRSGQTVSNRRGVATQYAKASFQTFLDVGKFRCSKQHTSS